MKKEVMAAVNNNTNTMGLSLFALAANSFRTSVSNARSLFREKDQDYGGYTLGDPEASRDSSHFLGPRVGSQEGFAHLPRVWYLQV